MLVVDIVVVFFNKVRNFGFNFDVFFGSVGYNLVMFELNCFCISKVECFFFKC